MPNPKHRDLLEKWGLTGLKLSLGFLNAEFAPRDADRNAAWELYVELLTRITTQRLLPEDGDEKTALDSVFALFTITRDILKRHGSGCIEFSKLAIPVLNQIIRPFTRAGTCARLPARSRSPNSAPRFVLNWHNSNRC